MTRKQLGIGVGVVALAAVASFAVERHDALAKQIHGEGCLFQADWTSGSSSPGFPQVSRYACRARTWSPFDVGDASLTPRCQVDGARCAVALHDRSAVPDLVRALSESTDEHDTGDGRIAVRAAFAEALGLLGDPRAITPLIETLQHSSVTARTASATALGHFGPAASGAIPHLERAARTDNPDGDMDIERLREAARTALARIDGE